MKALCDCGFWIALKCGAVCNRGRWIAPIEVASVQLCSRRSYLAGAELGRGGVRRRKRRNCCWRQAGSRESRVCFTAEEEEASRQAAPASASCPPSLQLTAQLLWRGWHRECYVRVILSYGRCMVTVRGGDTRWDGHFLSAR